MKIASFVIGIIGLIVSLIPIVGAFALYLFIPAFIFALIGIIISATRKTGHYGFAIAAICFCLIGGGISYAQAQLAKAAAKGLEKVGKEMQTGLNGDDVKIKIDGFAGWELGTKISEMDNLNKEKGFVDVKAKKLFRNFKDVRLHFSPKTFQVYQIDAIAPVTGNSEEESNIIIASIEKKYQGKMGGVLDKRIHYGDVSLSFDTDSFRGIHRISVVDKKLSDLANAEKKEIIDSKADTDGL